MERVEKDRLNVYLTKELKEKAKKKAREMGLDMSAYVTIALNEYMKQEEAVSFIDVFKQMQKDGKL